MIIFTTKTKNGNVKKKHGYQRVTRGYQDSVEYRDKAI